MSTNLLLIAIAFILVFGFLGVLVVLVEIRDACRSLRQEDVDSDGAP